MTIVKDIDLVVFGATGFTGKYVVKEVSQYAQKSKLKWAVAGRDSNKLTELMNQLLKNVGNQPIVLTANAHQYDELLHVVSRCKVLINCVGPFRFYGEPVVKACVEGGTHYVDINGETEFVERMYLKYNSLAAESKVSIVSTCGFDCIPSEMGLAFMKEQFRKQGFTASTVEVFVSLYSGPKGVKINYATYESAIESIAHIEDLRKIRKQLPLKKLPQLSSKRLTFKNFPSWESRIGRWIVPFAGSDSSVVRLGQQITQDLMEKKVFKSNPVPPVQFAIYYAPQSFFYLLGLVLFGTWLTLFSKFAWGRALLLKFPGFFSFGVFSKQGPTEEQIAQVHFEDIFIGKGFDTLKPESFKNENVKMIAKVTGPEPGYWATSRSVVACAITLLDESAFVPKGVLTPGPAFSNTSLIQRLEKVGFKFAVVETSKMN